MMNQMTKKKKNRKETTSKTARKHDFIVVHFLAFWVVIIGFYGCCKTKTMRN